LNYLSRSFWKKFLIFTISRMNSFSLMKRSSFKISEMMFSTVLYFLISYAWYLLQYLSGLGRMKFVNRTIILHWEICSNCFWYFKIKRR
jgi:hypothetical protein